MEVAHTATPWIIASSSMGVHHYIEARIGGGLVQEIASCGPTDGPEGSSGNAEFIVTACNNHDAFVSVLERIAHDATLTTLDMVALARTVIAKAGAAC
jgi:hypothetical protein